MNTRNEWNWEEIGDDGDVISETELKVEVDAGLAELVERFTLEEIVKAVVGDVDFKATYERSKNIAEIAAGLIAPKMKAHQEELAEELKKLAREYDHMCGAVEKACQWLIKGPMTPDESASLFEEAKKHILEEGSKPSGG